MTQFRHNMHRNPELGFKEFETQKSIKKYLLELGIPENTIKPCAGTGFTVDIYGKGAPSNSPRLVGLRADIDALPMTEANPELEYRS